MSIKRSISDSDSTSKSPALTPTQKRHLQAAAFCADNPSERYGGAVEPAFMTWYKREMFGKLTHGTFKALAKRGLVTLDEVLNQYGSDTEVYEITPAGRAVLSGAGGGGPSDPAANEAAPNGYSVECPQCHVIPPVWDTDYDDTTVADCPTCHIRFVLDANGKLLRSWSLDASPAEPPPVAPPDSAVERTPGAGDDVSRTEYLKATLRAKRIPQNNVRLERQIAELQAQLDQNRRDLADAIKVITEYERPDESEVK